MKFYFNLLAIIFLISCSSNDSEVSPDDNTETKIECDNTFIQKEDRIFGIDMLNETETGSFNDNLILAKELGAEFTAVHIQWSSLEPSPNQFTDFSDILSSFDSFMKANNIKLSLTIRPIDLTGKTVPSDLESSRFNSNEIKTRFIALLDFVFTKIDYTLLTSIQIGNEIDGYDISNEHPSFWGDYGEFLFEMTTYLHSNYPGLKVGFTATHQGLINDNDGVFVALSQAVDVLGVTYYPIDNDFNTDDPSVVQNDMNILIQKYNLIPIYMQEVGYHTSSINASTEVKQAQFFCNFFQSWDENKDIIKLVNIVRLNDLSQSDAVDLAGPYGISSDNFTEYLRTLGIRTYTDKGTNKMAFDVIKEETNIRGWN